VLSGKVVREVFTTMCEITETLLIKRAEIRLHFMVKGGYIITLFIKDKVKVNC
jgi:hypothetical protein